MLLRTCLYLGGNRPWRIAFALVGLILILTYKELMYAVLRYDSKKKLMRLTENETKAPRDVLCRRARYVVSDVTWPAFGELTSALRTLHW